MSSTVDQLAGLLSSRAPWFTVRTAASAPSGPGWVSCASVLSAQQAGEDPTASWRAVLERQYAAQYSIEPPRQVAAMFVLMWYAGVPARVAALATALTGTAPDVSPSRIAFRRHPTGHYPAEIALLPGPVLEGPDAFAVADRHCRDFADSFEPGVKLSSRQRLGAIADEYRAALKAVPDAPYAAPAAQVFGVDPAAMRDSCCFIYALPGTTVCSNCPRLADQPEQLDAH